MTNRTDHTASTVRRRSSSGFTRRSRGGAVAGLLAGLATLVASSQASAQEWLKDRRYQEGAGIRTGNLELHPGIGAEVGYDSNWFLRTYKDSPAGGPRYVNGAPDLPPRDAGVLRITPSFRLSTLTQQRMENGSPSSAPGSVAFNGGVSATYRELVGDKEVRDQRNVSVSADARLDILPGRPLGAAVFASYNRLIQPSAVSDPNLSFNVSNVGAGAEVIALPGGGTFDIRAGYQFSGALYEESNGVPFTNYTHELSVRDRWRFRPRTALFHDTTLRFITYPNADRALNYLIDSTPLRSRLGLNGLVTDRVGVLLAAGYGATFFQKPTSFASDQYDNFLAQAEVTFYLSRPDNGGEPGQASLLLSKLVFGYTRDFTNSLLGNYYTSNKGYARVEYFFAGRALLRLDGYFEGLSYPQPYYLRRDGSIAAVRREGSAGPSGDFTNFRVGGTLYGEYRFTDAFALTATVDYSQTISDVALESTAAPDGTTTLPTEVFDLNWRRVQAFLGARVLF